MNKDIVNDLINKASSTGYNKDILKMCISNNLLFGTEEVELLYRKFGISFLTDIIKHNLTLPFLNLSINQIGAEGCKAIADALKVNTSLHDITISYNQIGDDEAKAFADALKVNTTLTSLNLPTNQIGTEGAKAIAEALRVNSSLLSLDLECNQIGDVGAKAFAEALRVNNSLTSLHLWNSQIGDDGAKAIVDALEDNHYMTSIILDFLPDISSQLDNILERNKLQQLERNKHLQTQVSNLAEDFLASHCKDEDERGVDKSGSNKEEAAKALSSSVVSTNDYDYMTKHKASIIEILKARIENKKLNVKLEDFFSNLEKAHNNGFALENALLDLMGIEHKMNAITFGFNHFINPSLNLGVNPSTNNMINPEDATKLYELFTDKNKKVDRDILSKLKDKYNSLNDNDNDNKEVFALWKEFINHAALQLNWSGDMTKHMIELQGIKFNSTAFPNSEDGKANCMKSVLFHSLFPEYDGNVSKMLTDFVDTIKEIILHPKSDLKSAYKFINLLTDTVISKEAKEIVLKMLSEIYSVSPKYFTEPSAEPTQVTATQAATDESDGENDIDCENGQNGDKDDDGENDKGNDHMNENRGNTDKSTGYDRTNEITDKDHTHTQYHYHTDTYTPEPSSSSYAESGYDHQQEELSVVGGLKIVEGDSSL